MLPNPDKPPDRIKLAAPPTMPPVKKAAPVDAIGVIELFGATLLITNETREPAPIPLTTSPIIPVFKLEPIPLEPRLAVLVIDLRLAIGLVLDVLLFIVFVIRLLVVVFRLPSKARLAVFRTCPFLVDDFLFLNPPDFIIFANFLLAANCFALAK